MLDKLFDSTVNQIENAMDVTSDLLSGEAPDKRKIAELVATGMTVYAISEVTGYTVDAINKVISND